MKLTKTKILIGVVTIFLFWIISGILIYYLIEPSERGTFGDMFGSINALFSGLALFGIIVSILIQQKELNLQRVELSETREEFRINRLTSVLFKQIEYFNLIIENQNFDKRKIDTHIYMLRRYSNDYSKTELIDFISENEESTFDLIFKIIPILENFDQLLEKSIFKNEEKNEMKKLFFNNINPYLFDLITYQIKNMKAEDDNLTDFERTIRNIRLNNIQYILGFGGPVGNNTTPKTV